MENEIKDWVLVPRVATDAMLDAGVRGRAGGGLYGAYIEMIAAAPTPPAEAQAMVSLREMLELREATQNGRVTEKPELDIVRDARAALSAPAEDVSEGHADSCACLHPGDRDCSCHKAYGFATAEDMDVADRIEKAALTQQPATSLPDEDDSDLTVAYMAGRHDGRRDVERLVEAARSVVNACSEHYGNGAGLHLALTGKGGLGGKLDAALAPFTATQQEADHD